MVVLHEGEPGDNRYIPLATKRRTPIKNVRDSGLSPEQLQFQIKKFGEKLPLARPRSTLQGYDCMGLVFATRRTMVATDQLTMILTEDEYHQIDATDLYWGDVVVYKFGLETAAAHVGLVSHFEASLVGLVTFVISKWGAGPEYVHPIDEVPEQFGVPVEYWTDRRLLT